jgi:protocatechuate 3,4-dioxygenase beta subunit
MGPDHASHTSHRTYLGLLVAALAIVAAFVLFPRDTRPAAVVTDAAPQQTHVRSLTAIEPQRADTATIDGRVVDSAQAPLAGASVCALTPTPTCAISGANGAFAIANLAVTDVRELAIAAQRANYVVASWHRSETSTERHAHVLVAMKSGGAALTGVVRDAGGGPIAHAFVNAGEAIAEADDDGRYLLWLDPTLPTATASADGYAPQERNELPAAHLDFALLPEAHIDGTVVDGTTGRAMPQTHVFATTDDGTTLDAVSDDDGHFHIAQVAPAIYKLGVLDSHAFSLPDGSLPVGLGEHVDGVVVRVATAFEITGRIVVDPSGEPCTSSPYVVLTAGHDGRAVAQPDASGVLRAPAMPGTYHVEVSCAHHLESGPYDDIVVVDHDVSDQVWKVSTGATVTGRVTNTLGAPIADATVFAAEVGAADRSHSSEDRTTTAADGSFALTGLRPGRQEVRVLPPHRTTTAGFEAVVDVPADRAAHHDFVVDDTTSEVVGHVRFEDGSPAANVDVTLAGDSTALTATTDAAGRFTINELHGDYHATLAVRDTALPIAGGDATGLLVHLAAGSSNALELTTTVVPGEIRGHVVDETGQPIDDAFVAVEPIDPANPDGSSGLPTEVMVDADGSFVAGQLSAPSYRVRAYRKSGGDVVARIVAPGADLTLTLVAAGSIAGIVRLDGVSLGRFDVRLVAPPSESDVQTLNAAPPDGQFTLRGVTPGHYRLVVESDSGGKTVELDVAAGATTSVEIDLDHSTRIAGRVVEHATRRPLLGIEIALNDGFAELYTDANGHFELVIPQRGPVAISFMAAATDMPSTEIDTLTKLTVTANGDSIDLGDVEVTLPAEH